MDGNITISAVCQNSTKCYDVPFQTPQAQLQRPLFSFISDGNFSIVFALLFYWSLSLVCHWIDVNGYLFRYRIHTTAEHLTRNLVTPRDCVIGVLFNQMLQVLWSLLLGLVSGPGDLVYPRDYELALWASRIRMVRRAVPGLLSLLAIDARTLAGKLSDSSPRLALLLAGASDSAIASWEAHAAEIIYSYLLPALQLGVAFFVADTYVYFGHRWLHTNRFMFKHVHLRHHLLNVSYAYGSAYVHPLEHIFLANLSITLGSMVGRLSVRQGMILGAATTIKDMYDHCGYSLPWIPIRCDGNYHDIHHQPWGIKTNFATFSSFWDEICGTHWTDKEAAQRNYERNIQWADAQLQKTVAISDYTPPIQQSVHVKP